MIRGFALTIGLLAALGAGNGARADQYRPGQIGIANLFATLAQNATKPRRRSPTARALPPSPNSCASTTRPVGTRRRRLPLMSAAGRDTVAAPAPGQKPAAERARNRRSPRKARPLTPSRDGRGGRRKAEGRSEPQRNTELMNPIARPEPAQRAGDVATRNRRKEPRSRLAGARRKNRRRLPTCRQRSCAEPARPETPAQAQDGQPERPRRRRPPPRRRKPPPAKPATPVPRDNIPD